MDASATDALLRALQEEVAQFRLLANNVPVAIAYFEAAGNTCRFANLGYAQLFGRRPEDILGLTVAQVIGEDAAQHIQPRVDQVLLERRSSRYERTLDGPDGRPRTIEVHLLPHLDRAGQPIGAFVLISDITRHRRAEAALRESEERLSKFMHASAEGIVFHKDGLVTDANPPLLALLGVELSEMLGRPTLDFVAEDQRQRVREVIVAGNEIAYESAVLHRDGTRIPVEFIVRTLHYQGQRHRMTIVRDIRDRVAAQERIRHLAHHDALTGLPNRAAFVGQVQLCIERARDAGQSLALLFIDLDHFKRVNDSLGHAAGDLLLQTVARRIAGVLRRGDLVARFAGDEFVLMLAGNPGEQAAQEVAHKLLAAVGAPLQAQGVPISVTPSIGIALYPQHGQAPDELIKHADTAMYAAKAGGRAASRVFEPAMAEAAYAALAMEGRLTAAITRGEFELHYQPQLRLADGGLVGVEALLRWRDPERGLVLPDTFIPLAEARRLIVPIGHWVLQQALAQAARWRAAGLLDAPVAVNLSTLQFQAPGFCDGVADALRETGAQGGWLELELTERMLTDDLPALRGTLARLQGLGVRVAIDDFGTGHSSLARLKDLPIDALKIDASFVHGLPGDPGAAAIAAAILRIGSGLGLQVVAEGIEREAQRHWLRDQGCDAGQGFLLARPMPAGAFADWLRVRRPAS